MAEKLIYLEELDPITLYGVNNTRFQLLQKLFPKLKLVGRGNEIKVFGERNEINKFVEKLELILEFANRFNNISEDDIEQLVNDKKSIIKEDEISDDVIVYGNRGIVVRPKTSNQKKLVSFSQSSDLLFIIGPAGTGKTYTAIALAVKALKDKKIRKIVLTRPAVEAGENLGFLPGDLKEKLDPYLQPIYDALQDMLPSKKLIEYLDDGTIQIAPLAFMRGRTLANAFVILDEAQNCTVNQIKMFLTRMGENAKFMVTGDITQIDLPPAKESGLVYAVKRLNDIKGIKVLEFEKKDIVRHKLVKDIVKAFENS
jgi:phosphate starvation-inducible PhoH-like protein